MASQSEIGHAKWGKFVSPLAPKAWPTANYYSKHATKPEYDRAFTEAREFKLSHPTEAFTAVARIYSIKEDALKKSINRLKNGGLRQQAGKRAGGQNKILSEAQDAAVVEYCYNQWEIGLGATHDMVYAAICHLKKVFLHILLCFSH